MTNIITRQQQGLEVLGMKINSLNEAMKLAEFFAKSDLVPKDYIGKPGNIVVAWQKGYEVGLMPQQSLETIAVINGRACIWGDGLIGLVKNSSKEEWTNEWIEGKGDNMVAYCETKRKGQTKTIKQSFSVTQAKTAGLWGKNTWAKYPVRMLQMRARAFCFRDAYPDVLNGLQVAEEQLDVVSVNDVNNTIDTTIVSLPTFEELETALKPLSLTVAYKDDYAIASGDTYNHQKTLNSLGFKYVNGEFKAPVEAPNNSSDSSQPNDDNTLAELGLSIIEKTVKGKVYQIVEGETMGLDKVLTEHGFTKGQTGRWGKEKGLF